MQILVVGANGQVGKQLVSLLMQQQHQVRAMIRDHSQAPLLEGLGAKAVLADLEGDIAHAVKGADAIIFTAGSGGHTGPDKTELVDHLGAIKTIGEAERLGVNRYVMLSALRAKDPDNGPETMHHYLVAKKKADNRLQNSSLNYTIVRPGRLSNEEGSGRVEIAENLPFRPEPISRVDVAYVLASTVDLTNTYRRCFDLLAGETPVMDALREL
ncbi:SDR family oxidoreductase [Salinithrix halophila]|uniref:SDR family oxidoreductase n=1 Tax=Salinithrix halophila TaxID=1485204 RepID=A0ABV8JG68_9BACL